ncbi:hypothetical protein CJ179_01640 [Rhodococcus sp. ACS1]|nr:hypothetical protein CJ179_01640 [Rhodococcus sp. ACS1]
MVVAPDDPRVVWAAIEGEEHEDVIARSTDLGDTYQRVKVPVNGRQVWSLAISPHDPKLIFAGTRPAGLIRSTDGGETWSEMPIGAAKVCSAGKTRLLSLTFTDVPGELYAGIEIDGIYFTKDNGETWTRFETTGGRALLGDDEVWKEDRPADIHAVTHSTTTQGHPALSVAMPIGYFRTEDLGKSWYQTRFPEKDRFDKGMFYARSIATKVDDPTVVFVGVGRRPPEHVVRGGILRSDDGGDTWVPVSPVLRSEVWAMASHPDMPDTMVAITLNGQVLVTTDGGLVWELIDHEFGETRALAITPLVS